MQVGKKNIIAIVLLCCISVVAKAQFRKYSNEFLNIGAGAQGLGMGGAQIATTADPTSGYWNPAGLANVKQHNVASLMHAQYFSGIAKYDFGAIALPTKNEDLTLGISVLRFGVDDIPNTLYLVNPDGSIDYNNISSFSSSDLALLLSAAKQKKLANNAILNVGGSVKIIRRTVGSFAGAWGLGIDAGVQYYKNNFKLAAVLRDATTTYNAWNFTFTDREKEILYLTQNEIPVKSTELTAPRLTVGGGYNFGVNEKINIYAEANATLSFDGQKNALVSSKAFNIEPNAGVQLDYNKAFWVRAGVGNFQRALADSDTSNQKKVWIFQPALGAGVKLGNAVLDYAFSNLANQSNPLYTHIFSLKFDLIFNRPTKK